MMQPEQNSADIQVLVSVGAHPKTARPRRSDQDARALELALSLNAGKVNALHAGNSDEHALRQYLGMGCDSLTAIELPEGADAVPALVSALRQSKSNLVLCGGRAEQGESSGMVPYLVAESLGWSVVPRVAAIESRAGNEVVVLQALPRGQRRKLSVKLPCLLCVDEAGPAARQSAYGLAMRGDVATASADIVMDEVASSWDKAPARKRAKRLKVVKATSAADRFKAATAKQSGGGGKVITPKTPEEGAAAILAMLKEEGVLRQG
ncbi:electron transfer flavoprotein subunit beta [Pokkaliibacter sp. CJK22405]|uniref:electron transfer flavoprotein subunit beta n=1 Tax=Pokkaliibacter sp. CJK22405 TaxID=3384615 RepID=UPI0039853200